jgi:DNA-binding MarR family transcriptional regulator
VPQASPELDDLARALYLNIGRIARILRRSHQRGELTLSEASLLARIDNDGPITPGALAEAENVRPQAIAATLTALESMGYVDREPDPNDGRRSYVSLSSEGQALRKERRNESTSRLVAAIAETVDPDDLPHLRDAVALIARLGDAL